MQACISQLSVTRLTHVCILIIDTRACKGYDTQGLLLRVLAWKRIQDERQGKVYMAANA